MTFDQSDNSIKRLLPGQGLLVLCCIFYLIWWGIIFRPGRYEAARTDGIMLGMAALSGILGIIFTVGGMRRIAKKRRSVSSLFIFVAGVAIYIILLAITRFGMGRQVTTELFLIVGWSVLELCVLSAVYGGGIFPLRGAVVWSIVVAMAAAVSLVCYLFYYQMADKAGYIDGMVPLVLIGIVVAGISVHLFQHANH